MTRIRRLRSGTVALVRLRDEHGPTAGITAAAGGALTAEGDTMARRIAALLIAVVLLALLLLILDHLGDLQR